MKLWFELNTASHPPYLMQRRFSLLLRSVSSVYQLYFWLVYISSHFRLPGLFTVQSPGVPTIDVRLYRYKKTFEAKKK